jgi:hypothetical protein
MHYHPCSFIRNPGPAPPLPPGFINPADMIEAQTSDLPPLDRLRISDTSVLNNGQVREGAANAALNNGQVREGAANAARNNSQVGEGAANAARALLAESLSATAILRPRSDNDVSRPGWLEAILSQSRDLTRCSASFSCSSPSSCRSPSSS